MFLFIIFGIAYAYPACPVEYSPGETLGFGDFAPVSRIAVINASAVQIKLNFTLTSNLTSVISELNVFNGDDSPLLTGSDYPDSMDNHTTYNNSITQLYFNRTTPFVIGDFYFNIVLDGEIAGASCAYTGHF